MRSDSLSHFAAALVSWDQDLHQGLGFYVAFVDWQEMHGGGGRTQGSRRTRKEKKGERKGKEGEKKKDVMVTNKETSGCVAWYHVVCFERGTPSKAAAGSRTRRTTSMGELAKKDK